MTKIEKTNDQVFDQALSKLNLEPYDLLVGVNSEKNEVYLPCGIDPKTGYISTFITLQKYNHQTGVTQSTHITVFTNDPKKARLPLVKSDTDLISYKPLDYFPLIGWFMEDTTLDPEFIKLIEESKKL